MTAERMSHTSRWRYWLLMVVGVLTAAGTLALQTRTRTTSHSARAVEVSPSPTPIPTAAGMVLTTEADAAACRVKTDARAARLVAAARERLTHDVRYDPAYVRIPYPGGDVPADQGVCTDEVIRIYRAVGYDLQKLVHEDIVSRRSAYPLVARHGAPDTNIDHRRVPNLMMFFKHHGDVLPLSDRPADYAAGDIVAWDLGGGLTHIGILIDLCVADGTRPLVVHNIGYGPAANDVLFAWRIIGHYRYPSRRN